MVSHVSFCASSVWLSVAHQLARHSSYTLSYSMCCSAWHKSLFAFNSLCMTVANGWGLSSHQTWCRGRGAQTRRSALRWRFHYTRHRRTTLSLAYLLQFYRSTSSTSGTPLVCCVFDGGSLQQRSAHQNDRVSGFDFAIPTSSLSRTGFLNMVSQYLMGQTADILPIALVQSVDPNVVVQKRVRSLNDELIVRGFF